ncbi:hypothetical protein [Streptomyces sp. NPDC007205]|uniref:hypothetical protein n=1 Tax=Streptomyces sp. NPDC007205 TaxID=3154316 RepID=UPI0033E79A18
MQPKGAVVVVDRREHQGLAGGHVGGHHGAQDPAGEVVVQGEAAAVAEPHALGQSEGFLLGKEVCDGIGGNEAEVDRDLVSVMAHGRVGGEGVRTACRVQQARHTDVHRRFPHLAYRVRLTGTIPADALRRKEHIAAANEHVQGASMSWRPCP